jgi:phosphate transport system substrate-binding protein
LTAPFLEDVRGPYGEVAPNVTLRPTADLASDLVFAADPTTAPFVTPIGSLTLRVVVHPTNPLTALTTAQVRALFTGQADWASVSGPQSALGPVSREPASAAVQQFNTRVLLGAAPSPTTLVAPSWEAMRAAVAQDAGALGYLPARWVDGSVRPLALGVDLRVLIVAAAPAEPTGVARDLLVWLQSPAGQAVMGR